MRFKFTHPMKHQFRGNLKAYYCGDCSDRLYHAKVKLYQADPRAEVTVLAVASEKDTFHQRSEEELKALDKRLIAEAETDDQGNFSFVFDAEKTGYKGGPLEIDFACDTLPLDIKQRETLKPKAEGPLQFHITTLQPAWKGGIREQQDLATAYWEYAIPHRFWCNILRLFGLHVICGHVHDCKGKQPVGGVKVLAFDVDLIQDDPLGYGITANDGHFKIYYTVADYSHTIFSWLNVEWPAGPDVYFRIEAADGTLLLNENRQRGHDRDRSNLSNCFCIDFCVECPKGSLSAGLTAPAGCYDGSFQLLNGKYIPITGTASGCGLERYELSLLWNGTDTIANSIVYANTAGNPDTGLSQGDHSVFNGPLGFIDVQRAIENAGARIATSTSFTVHLRVYSGNGSTADAWISFQLDTAEVYIKNIGGRTAPDVLDPNEQLHLSDSAAAALGTIGGTVGVYGAARVYGCSSEQIKEYTLYYKHDDFSSAQPPTGPQYNAPANGWTQICRADYSSYSTFTPAEIISNNELPGPLSRLTNNGFYTYQMPVYIPLLHTFIYIPTPKLNPSSWGTGASGRYSVLLEVVDTAGTYYYDIQKVWIDNENITGIITKIGDQPPCTCLYMRDSSGNFKTIDIKGIAFDPLIIPADFTAPTSDNFDFYRMVIQKQSSVSAAPQLVHSTSPVPARPALVPAEGILTSFNLANLDMATNPAGWPMDQLLAEGTSCNYNFILYVQDKTIVSEYTNHNNGNYYFPVKIINGNEP